MGITCLRLLGVFSVSALFSSTSFSTGFSGPTPFTATYNDVRIFMNELARSHASTARIVTVGTSDSGQTIQGLAIGDGPVKNMVVASHHGNEYGSVEVARAFATAVAINPIKDQTVYVIPVLNISGYDRRSREEISSHNRSTDPNRDYPGPCSAAFNSPTEHALKSTAALSQFVEREGIVSSATLHTYFPAVVYPWGIATHDLLTAYNDLFRILVDAATVESHYQTGNSTEVIYPANGTYEDYAFWKHGIWSLLFELGETHYPSIDQINRMTQVNVPGLRRFFEQAPKTRAADHTFRGTCDASLLALDRHDE